MERQRVKNTGVLILEPKIIFFGTIVAKPTRPLVVSESGFSFSAESLVEGRPGPKISIQKESLTRLECHFCKNLAIIYIAVNTGCSKYIRSALGLDTGLSFPGDFNSISRNSCHTKVMIVMEKTDWGQAAAFSNLMFSPNTLGKGNFIFTELNHTSALSGYTVLKKVVKQDIVPILADKCIAQHMTTVVTRQPSSGLDDKTQGPPVMVQVTAKGVDSVSDDMLKDTSNGWKAAQQLPRTSDGFINISPSTCTSEIKSQAKSTKRKASFPNVVNNPSIPVAAEGAAQEENDTGPSFVITNVTSLAPTLDVNNAPKRQKTIKSKNPPASHPPPKPAELQQNIEMPSRSNNNNVVKSVPVPATAKVAADSETLGVSLSAVVMSIGPYKGIPVSFVDIYDRGMNIWFLPDSPPRNLLQFNGHLSLPGQDIIRCLSYFHEEASSGLIIFMTPVFATILYNILNSHSEFSAYLDSSDKLNSYNVASVLLGPVDSTRSVQVQHNFQKLSAKSLFGPLLSFIDFQTACAFLKSCFATAPEIVPQKTSQETVTDSAKNGDWKLVTVEPDGVEMVSEDAIETMTCPYSLKIMKDPVQNIYCKHNYDRQSIIHYMFTPKKSEPVCPVVGCSNKKPLEVAHLVPNEELRNKIRNQFGDQISAREYAI